jgi:hypothetical protein
VTVITEIIEGYLGCGQYCSLDLLQTNKFQHCLFGQTAFQELFNFIASIFILKVISWKFVMAVRGTSGGTGSLFEEISQEREC